MIWRKRKIEPETSKLQDESSQKWHCSLMRKGRPETCGPEFCGLATCGPEFCGPATCGPEFCGPATCGLEFFTTKHIRQRKSAVRNTKQTNLIKFQLHQWS